MLKTGLLLFKILMIAHFTGSVRACCDAAAACLALAALCCCCCCCRITANLQRTLSEHARPSKEMLLQPLPLDLAHASGTKDFKRTMSCAAGNNRAAAAEQAPAQLPALPTGGLPAGLMGPSLPAAFPATPTGAARNMQQHLQLGFGDREARTVSGSGGTAGASRLSGLSVSGSPDSGKSSSYSAPGTAFSVQKSSSSFSGGASSNSNGHHNLGQLQDTQAALGDSKPEAATGLVVSLPSPKTSFSGCSTGAHLSHLHPAAASVSGGSSPAASAGSYSSAGVLSAAAASTAAAAGGSAAPQQAAARSSPSRSSAAGSPLKPGLGLGLKVMLPPETDFELCGSSDSFCFSPNTPGPKSGIKERMKFYFQRQAGAAGGF